MDIDLIEETIVSQQIEKQFKIIVNGKEIWISKWSNISTFECEGDIEIFKGKELLTEEEEEAVIEYIEAYQYDHNYHD